MILANLTLWALVVTSAAILSLRFKFVSLIWLGYIGLLAYSLPVLLGLTYIPELKRLAPTSIGATEVMTVVWLSFIVSLLLGSLFYQPNRAVTQPRRGHRLAIFTWCALGIFSLAYIVIAWKSSPLFFLGSRGQTSAAVEEAGSIFWFMLKWSAALMLLSSFQSKQKFLIFVGVSANIIVALGGDRTTPVIAACALLVLIFSRTSIIQSFVSKRIWLSGLILIAIVFLTKPIYTSISTGRSLFYTISQQTPLSFALQWEAFIIQEILERVVASGFTFDFGRLVAGVGAQLLVVPSFFGVRSSQFNDAFQPKLFPNETFGLAYNLWAQFYSVGGIWFVAFGASILALLLLALDRVVRHSNSPFLLLATLVGSAFAVYAHRNSAENIIALCRQIFVVFIPIWIGYLFFRFTFFSDKKVAEKSIWTEGSIVDSEVDSRKIPNDI